MKRRSKIIRKGDRARRSKASKPKRGPTPNKPSRSTSSDAGEQREIARLAHELNERSVEVGLRAAIGWLFSGGNTSDDEFPLSPQERGVANAARYFAVICFRPSFNSHDLIEGLAVRARKSN